MHIKDGDGDDDDDDDDDDHIEVVETYHISRAPRPPCLVHSDPGGKKDI